MHEFLLWLHEPYLRLGKRARPRLIGTENDITAKIIAHIKLIHTGACICFVLLELQEQWLYASNSALYVNHPLGVVRLPIAKMNNKTKALCLQSTLSVFSSDSFARAPRGLALYCSARKSASPPSSPSTDRTAVCSRRYLSKSGPVWLVA